MVGLEDFADGAVAEQPSCCRPGLMAMPSPTIFSANDVRHIFDGDDFAGQPAKISIPPVWNCRRKPVSSVCQNRPIKSSLEMIVAVLQPNLMNCLLLIKLSTARFDFGGGGKAQRLVGHSLHIFQKLVLRISFLIRGTEWRSWRTHQTHTSSNGVARSSPTSSPHIPVHLPLSMGR